MANFLRVTADGAREQADAWIGPAARMSCVSCWSAQIAGPRRAQAMLVRADGSRAERRAMAGALLAALRAARA